MKNISPKIRGRGSIHRKSRSPSSENFHPSDDLSDTEEISGYSEENTTPTNINRVNSKKKDYENVATKDKTWFFWLAGGILISIIVALYFVSESETISSELSIKQLRKQFPSQEKDFWISIKVAIEEIIRLNQPKSIIFLHTNDQPLEKILKSISEYTSVKLLSNMTKPVVLNGERLNKLEYLEDYGVLIAEIKEKLKDSAVVIIRNLDKMPGVVAQAFHSLCDEFNPVHEKVLYIFTLKVKSFPEENMRFVENRLRLQWNDLHSDKFYPLITRISTFVLSLR